MSAYPSKPASYKPVLLCILDGWGSREDAQDNAISRADTPFWDHALKAYPHTVLETAGLSVGLPDGQMGNSEVGHMNIGSGRIILQNLPRIDKAIQKDQLQKHSYIQKAIHSLKKQGSVCHIIGLLSPGGVHAHHRHIAYLANSIASHNIEVKIHAIADGRDTPPKSTAKYLTEFNKALVPGLPITIATLSGRYWAMDRDHRWERTRAAYEAMMLGIGPKANTIEEAVTASYQQDTSDEFIVPVILGSYAGAQDQDGIILANFRADRVRQLASALLDPEFSAFPRKKTVSFSSAIGMVEYSQHFNPWIDTLFKSEIPEHTLAQLLSDRGLRQLHIAETEKYAHVTFFFNGGREKVFPGEERILIPSPKVATYDLQPEMSAFLVTEKLIAALAEEKYDFIVVNYANTDMVGHTGNQQAVMQAVETIDRCLAQLSAAMTEHNGIMLVTADHGNAEQMFDPCTRQSHTAHTFFPVPFMMIGKETEALHLQNGRLCDIAPTILELMGIEQPSQMDGQSLIRKA